MEEEILETLKQIRDNQKTIIRLLVSEGKRYMTVEEAAEYLNVSVNYIKTLLYTPRGKDAGPELGYYLASSNKRFIDRDELDRYITRVRFRSNEEIKADSKRGKKEKVIHCFSE